MSPVVAPSPERTQRLCSAALRCPRSPTVPWEWVMPASPWRPLEALIVVLNREDALEGSPGRQMGWGVRATLGGGGGEAGPSSCPFWSLCLLLLQITGSSGRDVTGLQDASPSRSWAPGHCPGSCPTSDRADTAQLAPLLPRDLLLHLACGCYHPFTSRDWQLTSSIPKTKSSIQGGLRGDPVHLGPGLQTILLDRGTPGASGDWGFLYLKSGRREETQVEGAAPQIEEPYRVPFLGKRRPAHP